MRYLTLALLLLPGCRMGVSASTRFAPTTASAATKPAEPTSTAPAHRTYDRKDLESMVLGKTEDEVKGQLGEPATTAVAALLGAAGL